MQDITLIAKRSPKRGDRAPIEDKKDDKDKVEKVEAHELNLVNPDRITRFHTVPNEKFKTETDILEHHGYTMGPKIAEGGFAHVHKATYNRTKQDVACKIVDLGKKRSELNPYEMKACDLKNEIFIMGRLHNRYIIRMYTHFVINCKLYIFMKYANNRTLFHLVKENGPLNEKEARKYMSQMLVGVEHMQQLQVAHRDLKLENILMVKNPDHSMYILITDFGLSRIIGHSGGKNELLKTYCGTSIYMAPEVMLRRPYDAFMSDIWSLGVILYCILNASFPFDQTDLKVQLKAALLRDWEWTHLISPSKELDQILRGMMEPDVNKRLRLNAIIKHPWICNEFQLAKAER